MAPNTSVPEPELHGKVKNSNSTTILPKGTVESRGMGTIAKSRDAVSQEIQEFIDGEGNSLWAEIRSFFTVWLFVTRLPSPSWVDAHPGYLMRGMTYFPLCGAIIGTIVSAFYDVFSITLSLPLVASSIISEAVSLWCTGCFHEDGLADSADGIGGGWSREQILKIMTDTRLGTFGCAALSLYMIGKVDMIATLGRSAWNFGACEGGGPAIVVTQSLSRLVAPVLINTREYVDEGGPKYQFYSFFLEAKYLVTWTRAVFATVQSLVVSAFIYGFTRGVSLTIMTIVVAFFSGQYANRILGGVMGDYIGGTICITELVLLIFISSWDSFDKHILFLEHLNDIFWEYTNEGSNIHTVIEKLFNNDQSFAAFKFVITASILLVWCKNVGYQLVTDKIDRQDETPKPREAKQENTREISDKDVGKFIDLHELLLDPDRDFAYRYGIARGYVDSLAKPVGSLGTLEDWAARIAALQRTIKPKVASIACLIFAADHGVAKDKKNGGMNCSAYPQQVTKKVLEGLDHGIAGASVLAENNDVTLRVIDIGVAAGESENSWSGDVVRSAEFRVQGGTENFCTGNALTVEQLDQCLLVGRNETRKFIDETDASVMIFGEVGIGNTTTSSALIAWLSDSSVEQMCGSGATTSRDGINQDIVSNKISIVKKAMQYHSASSKKKNTVEALKSVGGAEIAAIVGGILEASERDVPILIDGFIVTVAGMIACKIDPQVCRCLLFATKSTEVGQQVALTTIADIAKDQGIPDITSPALDMNLRMGEATGALSAVPLVRSACAVISKLATLEDILSLEAKDKQIR